MTESLDTPESPTPSETIAPPATNERTAPERRRRRPLVSRPEYRKAIVLHTTQALRIRVRAFYQPLRALYNTDVILQVLALSERIAEDEMDTLQQTILDRIAAVSQEISDEQLRLDKLVEDHGITLSLSYPEAVTINARIRSPHMAKYIALITKADQLLMTLDRLWFAEVVTNKQRTQGGLEWQQKIIRLGREIVDIERRTHQGAYDKGAGEDLADNLASSVTEGDPDGDGIADDAAEPGEPGEARTSRRRKSSGGGLFSALTDRTAA